MPTTTNTVRRMATPDLTLTRTFAAPRPLVFRAWTEPAMLAEWWGPAEFTNPRCEVDARAGGVLRIDMRAPDGTVYPMAGTFDVVEPPQRLVFTAAALDGAGKPLFTVRTEVLFAARGERTEITLRAYVSEKTAAAAPYLAGMEAGWTQSLEKLKRTLGRVEVPVAELTLVRTFDAPRALVFAAWTNAEHIARWWGPMGFTAPVCAWDFRPGGSLRLCMRSPEGQDFWLNGMVREVTPPERLVFSTAAEDDAGRPILEDLNTVTFTEAEGRTTVTLHIQVLRISPEGAAYRAGMEQGWAEAFALLEGLVTLQGARGLAGYRVIEAPGQASFTVTRWFAAPPALVFDVMTQCHHMPHWYGPKSMTLTGCHIDLRPGGAFRWEVRTAGGRTHGFQGTYLAVEAPHRFVCTQRYVGDPNGSQTLSVTFTGENGGTRLTATVLYPSAAVRDRDLDAGRDGMQETYDRMDAYLRSLA